MKSKLSHFAVVFPCHDPEAIAEWYQDNLGFEITFKWEDPPSYVVTNRDEIVSIHFSKTETTDLQPNLVYIFCHDVDGVFDNIKENDIENISTPTNTEYRMTEFDVTDPWGNRITFGKGLDEA